MIIIVKSCKKYKKYKKYKNGEVISRISMKHQFNVIEQPSYTVMVASKFEEHTRIEKHLSRSILLFKSMGL